MAIDKPTFKKILGSFAAGVTVITTVGNDGKPYGLTATAFTSVSLEPPLVLICIDKRAESLPHLIASRRFAVSFLPAGQEELSNRFARSGGEKFDGVETRVGALGLPRMAAALAHLECITTEMVEAGDHTIFIGQVEGGDCEDGAPLVYFRGAYRKLAE